MTERQSPFARWKLAASRARSEDPDLFWARAMLGVALVVLLGMVATGDPREGIPERLAEGKWLRPKDYWRTWGWIFSLLNLGGVIVLMMTARRWVGSRAGESTVPTFAPPRRPGRAFAVLVTSAVLLGAGLAGPRLGQSLGEDEDQNLRQSIYGEWLPDGKGGYEEQRVGPGDVMRFYPGPNNHVAHSLLAHASIRLSQRFTGEPKRFASEAAMRMPAYLAGLGTLVVVALLAWRVGHLEAGVFAAFILAIHPWWVQYASEARGYTIAMLLLVGSLLLLLQALHRGSWRRWLAYGAAQLFLLWTLPSLVFQVAVMNVVAALLIWRSHRGTPALLPQLKRWCVVNALGAMAFLQLMGPNLAQLGKYLERTRGTHAIGARWVQQAVTHLFAGMPWRYPSVQGLDPIHVELADIFQSSPFLVVAVALVTLLGVVGGIVRLLRGNGIRPLLPVVFLLPPLLSPIAGRLEGANMYHWYVVYALPGLVLCLAVGLEGTVQQLGKLVPSRAAAAGILAGYLVCFGLLTEPARVALRERSFRPSREAAELTRPVADPVAPENERILTARLSDRKLVYDPRMLKVATLRELMALMGEAETTGKVLYINSGRLFHNRRHRPEVFALLDDSSRFELVGELPGGTPPMGRSVWRYLGSSSEPGVEPGEG